MNYVRKINNNFNFFSKNMSEKDLEVLSNIRIVRGSVRITSDLIETLDFLRNLEVIRAISL